MNRPRIALFGGTFDPIHIGHLRSILELKQQLDLDEVRLVPCHLPPHRGEPGVSSDQRLEMVRLAVRGETGLTVDDRELQRSGPSYTVETLAELRTELGSEASLIWVMGSDAFQSFLDWHQWQRVLELAHLVIMARPDYHWPTHGELAALLEQRKLDSAEGLGLSQAGGILPLELTPLPISATAIRSMISKGESPRYLLSDTVWDYIREKRLYHNGRGRTGTL